MSKPQSERKIVKYEEEPLLAELEIPELLEERQQYADKEKIFKAKKDSVSAGILSAVEAVNADTVLYTDKKGEWSIVRVEPEPSKTLDEDLLRENLMKIGKLDAAVIAKIFGKSTVLGETKKPYVRVYPPKNPK